MPSITSSQNTPVLPNMRRIVTRPSGASCSRRNSARWRRTRMTSHLSNQLQLLVEAPPDLAAATLTIVEARGPEGSFADPGLGALAGFDRRHPTVARGVHTR